MTFKRAISILSKALEDKRPETFTSSWIAIHSPRSYRFARLYLRGETGDINWDTVTRALPREFQKRWTGRKSSPRIYEKREEVDRILDRYHDKLYTFIAPLDRTDEDLCDRIAIALVRVAQRGNMSAQREATALLRYTADRWIETRPVLARWKYYGDQLDEQIAACIRRYRFTGSFLGYLYITLLYTARGLRPTYSLDDPIAPGSEKTRAESVVQDPETGEIRMYSREMYYAFR